MCVPVQFASPLKVRNTGFLSLKAALNAISVKKSFALKISHKYVGGNDFISFFSLKHSGKDDYKYGIICFEGGVGQTFCAANILAGNGILCIRPFRAGYVHKPGMRPWHGSPSIFNQTTLDDAHSPQNALNQDNDFSWRLKDGTEAAEITVKFGSVRLLDSVVLMEHITSSGQN